MWCPGWDPATERKTLGETKEIRMKYMDFVHNNGSILDH